MAHMHLLYLFLSRQLEKCWCLSIPGVPIFWIRRLWSLLAGKFLFFFARTRLYQFIDQTNVWRFSYSKKGINVQMEICAYILKERNTETSRLVRGIQLTEITCVIKNGMTKLALLNYLVTSWGVCHFFINGWYIDFCYRSHLFDLCCWPWGIRLCLLWW